jgi:hypothetical protein
MFRQDCTCPALLESPTNVTCTGLSPAMAQLSRRFQLVSLEHWPSPRSLATTSGVSVDVLSSGYLDVSVPRVCLCSPMYSGTNTFLLISGIQRPHSSHHASAKFQISKVGFPIRKSSDQSLFAAPRRLSQRTTSFIASYRQGIHQMPLSHLIALISNAHCYRTLGLSTKITDLITTTQPVVIQASWITGTQPLQPEVFETNRY